jgi:hypothetical protein
VANPGRVGYAAGMGKLPIDDSDCFWSRAEEARTMVEQMIDPEAKRMMISVAETYERLARRAEARQPKTQG